MLKNTFQHIPGIGPKSEARLWAAGAMDWGCLDRSAGVDLAPKKKATLAAACRESGEQLADANPVYFEKRISAPGGKQQGHTALFY